MIVSTFVPKVIAKHIAYRAANARFHIKYFSSGRDMTRSKRKHGNQQEADNYKKEKNQASQLLRTEGSNEEVLLLDVEKLLKRHTVSDTGAETAKQPYESPERFSEIETEITELSSTGEGLALSENGNHVYVVPFTVPGDVVKAKVVRYNEKGRHTSTDFLSVIKASPLRDDSRIKCPYFSRCSGCQFQMLDYADQLAHKRQIIERAYQNFSNLAPEYVPIIGETIGSPLQYGYRTKLTPHFDAPPDARRWRKQGSQVQWKEVPPIGYTLKGTRKTIDIEDCPIGTDTIRQGMRNERARVAKDIHNYKRGATLLLRESTTRVPKEQPEPQDPLPYAEEKSCVTDSNGTTTEYVDDYVFTNPAGSFFQNNNSILPRFTQYIRDHILGPPLSSSPSTISTTDANAIDINNDAVGVSNQTTPEIIHLLDAYSGSGLFTIALSPLFKTSTGIDISPQSIKFASRNAELNGLSEANVSFRAATAATIFDGLDKDPDCTAVVIDPPRKGCDEQFLRLLLAFGPKRVVYVSCNVHTQARDVGVLVEGGFDEVAEKADADGPGESKAVDSQVDREVKELQDGQEGAKAKGQASQGKKSTRYRIESILGFDFFPQTSHVESVAVLERVDN